MNTLQVKVLPLQGISKNQFSQPSDFIREYMYVDNELISDVDFACELLYMYNTAVDEGCWKQGSIDHHFVVQQEVGLKLVPVTVKVTTNTVEIYINNKDQLFKESFYSFNREQFESCMQEANKQFEILEQTI